MTDRQRQPSGLQASLEWIQAKMNDPATFTWVSDYLHELCAIDTTLREDIASLRDAELESFQLIAHKLKEQAVESHEITYDAINNRITKDEYYTWPRYAGVRFNDFDYVYGNRNNLLLTEKRASSTSSRWLLNAHIDTVPPFLPIKEAGTVFAGRGAVDDKAGIVAITLVLKWLQDYKAEFGKFSLPAIDAAITIDEEAGGNGSLSSAQNSNGKYQTIVVLEPTRLFPYPGNRGALWFQVLLRSDSTDSEQNNLLVSVEIIKKIFQAGIQLRNEGVHPLFLPEHVQVCIGILGNYGIFPASACESVEFLFVPHFSDISCELEIRDTLSSLLAEEAKQNGLVIDKGIFVSDVTLNNESTFKIQVEAVPGHMGSTTRDTDAAVKSAFLISAIIRKKLGDIKWIGSPPSRIEGGQGFTPRHTMADIKEKISRACADGFSEAKKSGKVSDVAVQSQVQFGKIHNEAFISNLEGQGIKAMVEAILALEPSCQIKREQLQGWQASCDARIFARECDDVITFGPGALESAHSPEESLDMVEIIKAAAIILLSIIKSGRT